MPKISSYVKRLKVEDADNDKNNKLIYFHTDDEKLLEKNIKLIALHKTKIRTYGHKAYSNLS